MRSFIWWIFIECLLQARHILVNKSERCVLFVGRKTSSKGEWGEPGRQYCRVWRGRKSGEGGSGQDHPSGDLLAGGAGAQRCRWEASAARRQQGEPQAKWQEPKSEGAWRWSVHGGPDPDGGFYSKRGRNHQRWGLNKYTFPLCPLRFFFFLLSFNINSMKAFPKLSNNDVAQGRSFSLWFQSAELVGQTIPSLISIAVH